MAKSQNPLIAGNWKMNGLLQPAEAEIKQLTKFALSVKNLQATLVICPPATLLVPMRGWLRDARAEEVLATGGQDCRAEDSGAFTGDLSAPMLKDAGASYVILGHSERRQYYGEVDSAVCAKATAATASKLTAIVCIGETLDEREKGAAEQVVARQIQGSLPDSACSTDTVIAYEPVWAIGTGRVAAPADVAAMHHHIRMLLAQRFKDGGAFRVLYGGSVKPSNAAELLAVPNVDGALVGGASLKAADFWAIAEAVA